MNRWLIFLSLFCTISAAYAANVSSSITGSEKVGDWQVIEISGGNQIVYRIGSNSTNTTDTLTFDFFPSERCVPAPVIMVMNLGSYKEYFNDGLMIFAYKLPSQKQNEEIIKTKMSVGDVHAFFPFKKLTVNAILQSRDKGKLAIWTPPSGDGELKRSENIHFSLKGFTIAYNKARKACLDNM